MNRWPLMVCIAAVLALGGIPGSSTELQAQQFRRLWMNFFGPPTPAESSDEWIEADATDVVLPEDGDLKRKLQIVRRQFESGKHSEATRQIGAWLQNPEVRDFFLNRGDERREGASFKGELRRMLLELPAEGRAVYLAQFEPVARQKLSEAIAAGDEASLRAVMLGFPGTPSGDEARFRLGRFLWDHGRPRAAAVCLSRLHSDDSRESTGRFEPALSLLMAASWQRAGDAARSEQILRELPRRFARQELIVAGHSRELPAEGDLPWAPWLASLIGVPAATNGGGKPDVSVSRADVNRTVSVPASAPLLAPRWRNTVSSDVSTQSALQTALQSHVGGRQVRLPLLSPLAAGDQLLVRTYSGVQSVDLETGAVRWQYPSDDDAGNAGLEQSLWSEPAGGAFAADAERFYLLERGTVIADDAAEPAFLSLAACDHFGGREGNLRWRIGGDEGSEPRLAGVRFLGAPVPRNGRLYAIVELKGAIWLMVLAAETGRLQWSQELAVVREEDGTSDFRRMAGAVPSISAEEIIVCPTSGGVVVAVDLTTQELLWAYRYPRKIRGVSDPYRGVRPRMEQDGRWIDAGVTIAADRVLITPPESDEMHCLDLHDGRPLWTRKRGDDLFLACAADGTGLLVGQRQVTAIHLADGRPAWPAPLAIPDEGRPSGRGVFVGAHYFLPLTTCEVVQVSLGGGQIDGRFKSLRESVPGNLVWHNGLFVSQGAEFLEAFDELDALQNRIAGELAVHPEDSGAHLRQGELDLAAGRIESSLSHFRRAYSLSRGSRTRSALAGALLTALRADPAEQAVYSKELDDLLEE